MYKNGDIVLAKIPYVDGSLHDRTCIVVNDELLEIVEVRNLTTQYKPHINSDILIKRNSSNKLRQDSYVKKAHKYSIKKTDIKRLIGHEPNYSKYL